MKINEKLLKRLDEMLTLGQDVLSTQYSIDGVVGARRVDAQLTTQWTTSTKNILIRIFGKDSEHYNCYVEQVDKHTTYQDAKKGLGVLIAARDDYVNDQLDDVKNVIEAELFDDFLEQASYLHVQGYFQPAAVITGCILEDSLRKLCVRNGIELSDKPKLDKMNADLYKSDIYPKLVYKRIVVLADLRNDAAHGNWDNFTADDVNDMMKDVRRFMEEHYI